MNTRVKIDRTAENQVRRDETDAEKNREDLSVTERVISLVVPQSKLNVVSKLLKGIGVGDIRIKYLRLHWHSQSSGHPGNYVSSLEVERMFRLEFYADDKLARQAIRIFSTFLHMQFMQTGEHLPTEIEEEVPAEMMATSGESASAGRQDFNIEPAPLPLTQRPGDAARQRRETTRLQARGHSDLNDDQHYLQQGAAEQNPIGQVTLKRGRGNPDLTRFVEDSRRYFDRPEPSTGAQFSDIEGREWSMALDNDGELELLGKLS